MEHRGHAVGPGRQLGLARVSDGCASVDGADVGGGPDGTHAEGPTTSDASTHSTREDDAAACLQALMNELYERMQDPAMVEAARRHFDASPEELGRAAVEAANRKRRERESSRQG